MAGRPTKLTTDVQKRIVQAIQVGATYELAASYGQISYRSFRNWLVRGEEELARRDDPDQPEDDELREQEEPFVQFFQAIKMAEGIAVVNWLAKIEQAATAGNWQAAAWKLERRYPEEYGRYVRSDITSKGEQISGPQIVIGLPDNERMRDSEEDE